VGRKRNKKPRSSCTAVAISTTHDEMRAGLMFGSSGTKWSHSSACRTWAC
jgi:hypothetical protein